MESPGSDYILQVNELTKVYPGRNGEALTVLDQVSFRVHPGETLALVGPSGSGKTTLLGLCAGLDEATSGEVALLGTSWKSLDEDGRALFRNAHTGFVFQNFQLIPSLTALENVMLPLQLRGERQVEREALALLEKVGLQHRTHHYPVQLSGGEQQRVAIARAFINQPKILFADEPTGNLDRKTSQHIIDLLFSLNEQSGTTLVLVTHDLDLAARLQRTLRMLDGRLVESDGTTTPES